MGGLGTGGEGSSVPLLSKAGCKAVQSVPLSQGLCAARQQVLSASWTLFAPCLDSSHLPPPWVRPPPFLCLGVALPSSLVSVSILAFPPTPTLLPAAARDQVFE